MADEEKWSRQDKLALWIAITAIAWAVFVVVFLAITTRQ